MSTSNPLRQLFQRTKSSPNEQAAEEENTICIRTDGLNVKLRTFPAVRHGIDSFDEPYTLFLNTDDPTRIYPRLKLEIVCMALPVETAGLFALDLRKLIQTSAIGTNRPSSVVVRAIYNAGGQSYLKTAITKRRSRYELRPPAKPSNILETAVAAGESLRRESRILFEYRTGSEPFTGQNTLTHWGQVVKLYDGENAGFLLKNAGGYRRYKYSNVTAVALEEPGGDLPIVTKVEYDSLDPAQPVIRLNNYHKQDQA